MEYVTATELRSNSARVWDKVAAGVEIVLTRNGKPFAIIVPTQAADIESNLQALRAASFGCLLTKQHARAVALGLDRTSLEEINAEIALARQKPSASEGDR